MTSKERRKALHKFGNHGTFWSNTAESSNKSNFNSNNIDNWLLSRTNPGEHYF